MKRIAVFMILLMIAAANINCLNSNSLCFRAQCEEYDESCEEIECNGRKSYECGSKFCAVDRKSCEDFQELSIRLRSFKSK